MKGKVLKITLAFFLIIILLLAIIYLVSWKSPGYYNLKSALHPADSIIPFKNYNADHPSPFIISHSNFVVFGASHIRNPHHPGIKKIEKEWKKLKPTVALVEGRLGFLLPGLMEPVETLGEGGRVMQLSKKAKIKIYNWDLSKEELALHLKSKFSGEQIALGQILNPYFSQMRFGKPADPEKFVNKYLKRAAYVNEQKNFKRVADVDRIWKKYFAQGKDWRETSDETALPGYLSEMMTYSNDLRNQHLTSVIKELILKGERPFVLCGSSHAVCIAPVFK